MVVSPITALPRGYALNEYRIESTLGIGGFGLTYLASDCNLNVKVAIKEFLPGDLAMRCEDQSVRPKSDSSVDLFKWGLARFLDESRTIAAFRHASIVRVMRFFEANQTAYMVMEFVAGEPLSNWIATRRPLDEQTLFALADPLLDGLDLVHRHHYLHRDIKPSNVFIREDGSPVLIDFGSARVTNTDADITCIVTPGYAPFEQYDAHGNQGPWSDLYAFGAVLYWIVTGVKPMDSIARVRQDVMPSALIAAEPGHYSRELLQAIDWALSPDEKARPQTVAQFRVVLQSLARLRPAWDRTVLVPSQASGDPAASKSIHSATVPPKFDPQALKQIEHELATHIGPIAPMVVRSAANKAPTLVQVVQLVAAEIGNEKSRIAFVKKFSADEKSPATTADAAHGPSQPPSQRFDDATLRRAESALASHIGAIARVLVRRAAARARDESELYHLLAEEIEDPNARLAFIRKSRSLPGTH